MTAQIPPPRLLRLRLAAQRLLPGTSAADPAAAARAVVGIQGQDLRAAALAIRSRVPGLTRAAVEADPSLVRTWTVRGTVHLLAADDLPWIHALTSARNVRRYDALLDKRGNLERAHRLLPDIEELLAERPRSRAELLSALDERGRESLGEYSINVLMPWLAARGTTLGLPDGTFRACDPPPAVDPDEALATLGRRYLAGYGPAGAEDLAKWSGLPLSACRRALESAGELESAGDLRALPGTLDSEPAAPPTAQLLAAFDTSMLGWRSREPLVRSADDRRVLPGGGIIRPVVLARGRAAGTWRLTGSGRRRRLEPEWFGRRPAAAALAAEAADVGRFLAVDVDPAS